MSPTNLTTPPKIAPLHSPALCVRTSFGTIGPIQGQLRHLLGCSSRPDDDRGAGLAFAHAGLPRPGRDLDCHHFILDCGDAPMLVLAAKHHDSCFYLLVNLADSASRQAILKADSFSGLEFVMMDGVYGASSFTVAVGDECRKQLRLTLAEHEGLLRDDHLWLLRLGEFTARLPLEYAKANPEAATSHHHHLLVLLGDREAHLGGVREALRIALGKYD